ncbi:CopC domain-containing protein YobA [Klebsiella grimontii]|uniref:Copper resistance protein C n=1 Tax=Klebsiella grimontii TaxID=2058152 RepID=A0ABU9P033_9ENTR|nr:CopC domain-containing protein YobA [Klebsiella grimontii]MDU1427081.1 CopC domain-containing protein YobA [Klebsiella michiganensis]MDU7808211.1 CopC domain-containing protein YobA [Serratia marcescens]MBZ6949742.1 CopC domain-containing protein YobA [Klebsiella grimontii]MDU4544472.1 CopC domain-containing protein YobA [Klebsiella michiganensis]MDU6352993.1 CopC domain-containing protein YobA [Klebsiella grimontii]
MPIIAGRALCLSLFLAGCLTSAGAFAHAHLQQPLPAAGSEVDASPQALTLSFSEGIETQFSGVTLTGPQQKAIPLGKPVRSDNNKAQLTVPVEQALTPGAYTVDWHVVSVDGHKTKGQYTFTVK